MKRNIIKKGVAVLIGLSLFFSIFYEFTQQSFFSIATQDRSSYFNKDYSITGNGADDIVNVALAQKGLTKSQLRYNEDWCANFVSDCAKLAGVSKAIPADGYCGTLYENIKKSGGYEVDSPQKGDIIFYYCNADYCPNSGKPWVHVGIMTSSNSSIEGNSNGKVNYKSTITYTDTNHRSL